MNKDYSLLVHAVHSRLQLIRHLLEFGLQTTPKELVKANRRYFDRTVKSIKDHHGFHVQPEDLENAAFLFMYTVSADKYFREKTIEKITHTEKLYLVQRFDPNSGKWHTIQLGKNGKPERADDARGMPYNNARTLFESFASPNGVVLDYRVVEQLDL